MLEAVLMQTAYAAAVNKDVVNLLPDFKDLSDIFGFAVNLSIGVGWALVLVMLAIGFVMYVLSKGEKTAVEAAQKWITYAIIGGVGLFFVMVIRNLIPNLLGATQSPNDVGGNIVP